jgi:hypothetical protein
MTDWKEYTGSEEQINELWNASNGAVLRLNNKYDTDILFSFDVDELRCTTHYWIIPDDPLRDMKIRQAQTGQPVFIKEILDDWSTGYRKDFIKLHKPTKTPEWSDAYEYSFAPFE